MFLSIAIINGLYLKLFSARYEININMGQLKRTLGLFDTALLSLGAIIGAGIFVVTGFASQIAGP